MGELYRTKTRLRLLGDIDRGEVVGYPIYDSDHVEYWWTDIAGRPWLVTSRVVEAMRAGWAVRGPSRGNSPTSDFLVRLSSAGRQALKEGNRG